MNSPSEDAEVDFAASESDVVLQTLAVASNQLSEAGLATWLKQNSSEKQKRRAR